jgi:hypothetical protein
MRGSNQSVYSVLSVVHFPPFPPLLRFLRLNFQEEQPLRSLLEVTHARCEDGLDFGSGDVFCDVMGVALGVCHFS